jgi:hypothetical protein
VALGRAGDDAGGLAAAAAGRRPLADVTVRYREERPLERTVEVVAEGGGTVTVTTRALDAACADPHDARCWRLKTAARALDPAAHRALLARLAAAEPGSAPREVDVAPGAPRFRLVVTVAGRPPLEAEASLAAALARPALKAARAALLDAAGLASELAEPP